MVNIINQIYKALCTTQFYVDVHLWWRIFIDTKVYTIDKQHWQNQFLYKNTYDISFHDQLHSLNKTIERV